MKFLMYVLLTQIVGKIIKLKEIYIKCSELNQKTNSFDYTSYSTYVVIFWANDKATIIELDHYFGSLGFMGSNGKDKGGYPWNIKEGHTYCF